MIKEMYKEWPVLYFTCACIPCFSWMRLHSGRVAIQNDHLSKFMTVGPFCRRKMKYGQFPIYSSLPHNVALVGKQGNGSVKHLALLSIQTFLIVV